MLSLDSKFYPIPISLPHDCSYLHSFRQFIVHCIKIPTADGTLQPLILNDDQQQIVSCLEDDNSYHNIVSNRQSGATTIMCAYYTYMLCTSHYTNLAIISDTRRFSSMVLDMIRDMYRGIPNHNKPMLTHDTRDTLQTANCKILLFSSRHAPYSMRGHTLNTVWVDNAQYVKNVDHIVAGVLPVMIHASNPKMILTSTR